MFSQNSLKVFYDAVLNIEGDETTVCELFELMTDLKLKLAQKEKDWFSELETIISCNSFLPHRPLL